MTLEGSALLGKCKTIEATATSSICSIVFRICFCPSAATRYVGKISLTLFFTCILLVALDSVCFRLCNTCVEYSQLIDSNNISSSTINKVVAEAIVHSSGVVLRVDKTGQVTIFLNAQKYCIPNKTNNSELNFIGSIQRSSEHISGAIELRRLDTGVFPQTALQRDNKRCARVGWRRIVKSLCIITCYEHYALLIRNKRDISSLFNLVYFCQKPV